MHWGLHQDENLLNDIKSAMNQIFLQYKLQITAFDAYKLVFNSYFCAINQR